MNVLAADVAAMAKVVATLGGREAREALAEKRPQRLEGAAARGAQDGFQCGEALLDRIEVRRTTQPPSVESWSEGRAVCGSERARRQRPPWEVAGAYSLPGE
jgi:hypothetical protein